MPLDKSFNVRNRSDSSQFQSTLNRIEKEKNDDLRMHNNAKMRFRGLFSKPVYSADSSIHGTCEVKMYETHNPGFCYKRNGQHRVQGQRVISKINSIPSIDYEHLHSLLFTDGEVDIHKIVCLYLLSCFETEYLTPPKKSKFYEKDSPLEQLLERSKKPQKNKLCKALPIYVLDISKKQEEEMLIEDGRLTSRLLINEKVLEIIETVLNTLEDSNKHKVNVFMKLTKDASALRRIFRNLQLQKFLFSLMYQPLMTNCSSFILTQPFKVVPIRLKVGTASGVLEEVVRHIRDNVFQYSPKFGGGFEKLHREITEGMFDFKSIKTSSFSFLPFKKRKLIDSDVEDTKAKPTEMNKQKPEDSKRFHLKQTKCSACMEKWRTPLPTPRVSKVLVKGAAFDAENASLAANSVQRLALLIDQEMYKLFSYERKYSNWSSTGYGARVIAKDTQANLQTTVESVDLDVLELQKIKQEIMVQEAQKKLKKFLEDTK